jgi:hypothetical protein
LSERFAKVLWNLKRECNKEIAKVFAPSVTPNNHQETSKPRELSNSSPRESQLGTDERHLSSVNIRDLRSNGCCHVKDNMNACLLMTDEGKECFLEIEPPLSPHLWLEPVAV